MPAAAQRHADARLPVPLALLTMGTCSAGLWLGIGWLVGLI